MRNSLKFIAFTTIFSTLMTPVLAVPQVLVPWQTSGNGTIKGDDFGSVPNMDILFRGLSGFGNSAEADRMYVWALWGPINYVSYTGAPVGSLFLRPDAGWTDGVTLYSFVLGNYGGAIGPNVDVRIYNGDFSSILFQQSYATGNFPINVSPQVSSLNGLYLQFSNTPEYIGITDITLEAGNIFPQQSGSNVPEPESWALLIAGFGLVGAAMRRRRRVAA
jgi:hypothetical protein